MLILHAPYTYYPDPVGGTEIYVEQLVESLRARGLENMVVAPGKARQAYVHRDIPVHRVGVSETIYDLSELYGGSDAGSAVEFAALLDAHPPDVVHLHAFTRVVSVRWVQAAHARGVPVVFTYHTPTVSCVRSGLMRWGQSPCDGVLDADRCTRCRLHGLGMPRFAADLVGRAPEPVRTFAATQRGSLWTALRMSDLVARQHNATRALMANVDHIVALCDWTRDVLLHNDTAPEKISVVPHGFDAASSPNESPRTPGDTLRVVALGRLEPIKGMDLLVRAMEQLPGLALTLDIYGIEQSETTTPFARQLRELVARDTRIRLLPPVAHQAVVPLLRQYEIIAVPSQWLETGPLVVLEAFAAGIPVLGANLGGIAEKVQDGVNGMLVPSFSVAAWRDALRALTQDRARCERLRAAVRPPRSMDAVAQEMQALYERVRERRVATNYVANE